MSREGFTVREGLRTLVCHNLWSREVSYTYRSGSPSGGFGLKVVNAPIFCNRAIRL